MSRTNHLATSYDVNGEHRVQIAVHLPLRQEAGEVLAPISSRLFSSQTHLAGVEISSNSDPPDPSRDWQCLTRLPKSKKCVPEFNLSRVWYNP